jgi:2-polyprenyl-3-methyl-5-hydroxy-6-metoxy-1,4-benzoquinol methylase
MTVKPTCRHCGAELNQLLIDLGTAPPSNAYLSAAALDQPEYYFPLSVLVCNSCWLVQTRDFARADELFDADYAYFSSYSTSWLAHAENYVGAMVRRFGLNPSSHVVEVAANDGYLLQYVKQRGIPCLGIEPTRRTADAARAKGIDIVEAFFGVDQAKELAAKGKSADLMIANNVLAHVPDINDFVGGFAALLKPDGVVTFEFPHLLNLIVETQFDTIYHEHFSYLSLSVVKRIVEKQGLEVFDVEEIPTHGGSLRVYVQRQGGGQAISPATSKLLNREQEAGLNSPKAYQGFQQRSDRIKDNLLSFLIEARREGKRVAAYGAAAKGNTLMNYAGIRRDLVSFVVDRNPNKAGKYLPGSRIPIGGEAELKDAQPDYVLVLPWNLIGEIKSQLAYVAAWGGKLVTAVPSLQIHEPAA